LQQNAFETLKENLSSPQILAYADYNLPFHLNIDTSGQGLGAVLYQKQDGKDRVIDYASRGLRGGEKNYPAHKQIQPFVELLPWLNQIIFLKRTPLKFENPAVSRYFRECKKTFIY
jgi:hypothetical protein